MENRHYFPGEKSPDHADESENVAPWKIIAVVILTVACLAVVYPNFLHPMIARSFGKSAKSNFGDRDSATFLTEKLLGARPEKTAQDPSTFHSQFSRSHVPPIHAFEGARATFQSENLHHTAKNRWHWMLPLYTIGVVVFLLYTLVKIFFKQPARNRSQYNFRYNTVRECFEVNNELVQEMEKLENRENFADVMSDQQLKLLHGRLKETEGAMHKILSQLEHLPSDADQEAADEVKKSTLETLDAIFEKSDDAECSQQDIPQIRDLEKALAEFRKFTESYVDHEFNNTSTKSSCEGQNPSENLYPLANQFDARGSRVGSKPNNLNFDATENDETTALQNDEGQIIDLSIDCSANFSDPNESELRKRLTVADLVQDD